MPEIQETHLKILKKRNGGAINFNGIYFQLDYLTFRI